MVQCGEVNKKYFQSVSDVLAVLKLCETRTQRRHNCNVVDIHDSNRAVFSRLTRLDANCSFSDVTRGNSEVFRPKLTHY